MKKIFTAAALVFAIAIGSAAVLTVAPQQAQACSDGW
jgi:hypothetical protein